MGQFTVFLGWAVPKAWGASEWLQNTKALSKRWGERLMWLENVRNRKKWRMLLI